MKTALVISFLLLGQNFNIELAISPVEKATGLMYRREWTKSSQGMLFLNKTPKQVSFWMKDTYLNMTIFYLDKNLKILEMHRPKPLDESGIPSQTDQVQYILELNPIYEKFALQNWVSFSLAIKNELKEQQESIDKLL